MKALKIILAVTVLLFGGLIVKADNQPANDKDHGQTIESVLKDIRQSQGVKSNELVDCEQVTDKQFEHLGESYMDVMHPNPKEHALMDRMMGGREF